MYKCAAGGKQFLGEVRLNNKVFWQEFHEGKQTYSLLTKNHGCSSKTIQLRLDQVKISPINKVSRPIVVMMDTTYFGLSFGVMLFKDANTGDNLHKVYVKH